MTTKKGIIQCDTHPIMHSLAKPQTKQQMFPLLNISILHGAKAQAWAYVHKLTQTKQAVEDP